MSNPISEDCSSGLHEYCTPCECVCHDKELKKALEICVKLQSHYAELLNMYDGGKRHPFKDGEEFIRRMKELQK